MSLGIAAYNLGRAAAGGKVAFTSNRDGVRTPRGYPLRLATVRHGRRRQKNVEKIGHLNVAQALPRHPQDGRIIFSTLESQGVRHDIEWASGAFTRRQQLGAGRQRLPSGNGFHFQTQLSTARSSSRNTTTRTARPRQLFQTATQGAGRPAPFGPAQLHPTRR